MKERSVWLREKYHADILRGVRGVVICVILVPTLQTVKFLTVAVVRVCDSARATTWFLRSTCSTVMSCFSALALYLSAQTGGQTPIYAPTANQSAHEYR
ncbi:MAG: hypothetical protein J07HQW1_03537 [Haloquadratum walsbyi J07HQW1]|uniref:Uncharacterized protein n=1 Tax=Haloquadratum walsbyi J07HQW1 TaxID=1238424 RepID=U1MTA0_9EURY|nr:MAG: hypothetical protein J07HQW1_03537 [Haloquadratum walsbyi J07HQW1]